MTLLKNNCVTHLKPNWKVQQFRSRISLGKSIQRERATEHEQDHASDLTFSFLFFSFHKCLLVKKLFTKLPASTTMECCLQGKKFTLFTILLFCFVPLISANCAFIEAQACINNVQMIYDQFKTDLLNESYVPKPSASARICNQMVYNSTAERCFRYSLENCSSSVKESYQRRWDALKEDHDIRCNSVWFPVCCLPLILLLLWTTMCVTQ